MEIIRRRAAAQAVRERLLIHPGIGTVRAHAEGKIAHDADIQASMPCIVGGPPKLPVGKELQILVKR
jgi:hypothetical protein